MSFKSHHTVIEAQSLLKPFDFKEILQYKDLFYLKVINGLKAQQRQTIMSYFWVVFDPLMQIVFFSVIFGYLLGVETSNYGDVPYPVFSAAAMAGWLFFQSGMSLSVASLSTESHLLQKIYFPRLFIPIIPIITMLPNFFIQLGCVLIVLLCYGVMPSIQIWLLIPVLIGMATLSAGVGLLLGTFFVQFRDLGRAWGYFIQFFRYAVPLAYPASEIVDPTWRFIYMLNPGATYVECSRIALLGGEIPWGLLGIAFVFSVVILYVGAVVFRWREPNIVDAM